MRAIILFLLLITMTLSACYFQQGKKHRDNPVSSISIVEGKYQLDSNRILYNYNLGQLIEDLEETELVEKNTFSEVPLFIRSFLDALTDTFEIANPGEDWQVGCTPLIRIKDEGLNPKTKGSLFGNVEILKLPRRQLIYFGIGDNIAVMRHFRGGVGRSEHILIFKFENNAIVDFWCGLVRGIITNKTELLSYLKENKGKVKEEDMILNTNFIYF